MPSTDNRSLFAIRIFSDLDIIFNVGSNPLIPDIALIEYLTLFFIILFIFLIPKYRLIFFF